MNCPKKPRQRARTPEGVQTMSVHIRGSRQVLRLAAAATLAIAATGAAHAQQKTDVIFSAGPTGGSWTPMAAAASQVVNKRYSRTERAGRAGRGPRQHGEDPQRQGRYRLVDDDRHVRRAEGRRPVRRQADRQGPVRRQLLPQRLAAGGSRQQRHQEHQGSEGPAGGAAVTRQHQPGGRLGVSCSRSTA